MESMLGFQTRREVLLQMIPRYRQSSVSHKGALLDEMVAITGYARRYAMWLLNHPQEVPHLPRRRRPRTFGPEVQHALVFAWQAANQICSKRLLPYLPTLIESLERQGHLHLTDACRSQLLSMSAATADRLLHVARTRDQRGLATTRAGTLLKQQISIRTFQQWNETQPGFIVWRLSSVFIHSLSTLVDASAFHSITYQRETRFYMCIIQSYKISMGIKQKSSSFAPS